MCCCVNKVSGLSRCVLPLSSLCYNPKTLLLFLLFLLEVVADDTPAVQAVLKADTRRLKLLEEEKQLQALLEKGEDAVVERLDKVNALECKHIHPSWIFIIVKSLQVCLRGLGPYNYCNFCPFFITKLLQFGQV